MARQTDSWFFPPFTAERMHDPLQRALVSVRAMTTNAGGIAVYARAHKAVLGRGWSFDIKEPAMTGAEMLLGSLAAEVLELFLRLARQQRLTVDEMEASLQAELKDPLVHLGVIGAEGEPRYSSFTVKVYAGSPAPADALRAVWEEAVRRAPLLNTLRRAAPVQLTFQQT